MPNPFQGSQARLTGNQSQLKSVKWILGHPEKYGVVHKQIEWLGEKGKKVTEPETEYIFNRLGDGSIKYLKDLFSTTYDFIELVNKERKPYKKPLRAGFDIMSIPNSKPDEQIKVDPLSSIFYGYESEELFYCYLIQVKTNYNHKSLSNQLYVQALRDIVVPPYFKKELHIWSTKDSSNIPDIINLD